MNNSKNVCLIMIFFWKTYKTWHNHNNLLISSTPFFVHKMNIYSSYLHSISLCRPRRIPPPKHLRGNIQPAAEGGRAGSEPHSLRSFGSLPARPPSAAGWMFPLRLLLQWFILNLFTFVFIPNNMYHIRDVLYLY